MQKPYGIAGTRRNSPEAPCERRRQHVEPARPGAQLRFAATVPAGPPTHWPALGASGAGPRTGGVLGVLLALLLAACGGAAEPPSGARPSAAAPAPQSATPAASTKPAVSAAALTSVKSAYVVLSTHTLPSWIASDQGYFKQNGLDVQMSYIAGSTAALPALASGELGMLHASPATAVQSAIKGQDVVILAQHIGTADNRLVARAGINSLADLKGKAVAATRPGTVADLVLREMLKRNNLAPDKDVQISFMGDQSAMAAALQNGAIQAALVDVPFYLITVKQGAHVVYNTLDLHYPYPVDGVLSTRKFVREHPDVVNGFLKSYVQGLRFMRANPPKTQEILGKQTKESDAELLKAAYDDEMQILRDDPQPDLDGIKTVLPLFGGEGKDPASFVDTAPLQRALQELGPAKQL